MIFRRNSTKERVIRLEIVIDALLSLLTKKDVVSHDEMQKQIIKNATKGEEE